MPLLLPTTTAYKWPLLLNLLWAALMLWPLFSNPDSISLTMFIAVSLWGNFVGVFVSLVNRNWRAAAWFSGFIPVMLGVALLTSLAFSPPTFLE